MSQDGGPHDQYPEVTVARFYEVECHDRSCGRVVAVEGTRAQADQARREHLRIHREDQIEAHYTKPVKEIT